MIRRIIRKLKGERAFRIASLVKMNCANLHAKICIKDPESEEQWQIKNYTLRGEMPMFLLNS